MSRTYRKPPSFCWNGRIPTKDEYEKKPHLSYYYGEYEEFVAKLVSDNYRWGQIPAWYKNVKNRKVRRAEKHELCNYDDDRTVMPRRVKNAVDWL